MNLKQLRNLVVETVREEQKKTTNRKWNKLVENTVRRVLLEEEDLAPGDSGQADSQTESGGSSGEFKQIVKDATKLGQVDVTKAKALLSLGDGKPEDAIQVGSLNASCKDLKPSQSSMNLGKAVHFALGMLNGTMYGSGGPGGDLGAFTCGGYLLDGHHRWIATCMVKPTENVQGYDLQGIGAEDAVRVLNVATAAVMGHNQGKTGEGSFKVFSQPEAILAELQKAEVPQDKSKSPTEICETWAAAEGNSEKGEEALKWAAQKMVDNCAECPGVSDSAVLITSNVRVDMPVADDPEHAAEKGGDIEPGFEKKGAATQKLIQTFKNGELDLKESGQLERWSKLAGILKD